MTSLCSRCGGIGDWQFPKTPGGKLGGGQRHHPAALLSPVLKLCALSQEYAGRGMCALTLRSFMSSPLRPMDFLAASISTDPVEGPLTMSATAAQTARTAKAASDLPIEIWKHSQEMSVR